jgi:hypothetical protein
MKRRIVYLLTGLALIASFSVGSPGGASAEESEHQTRCNELATGIVYNVQQGNIEYAQFLGGLFEKRGCEYGIAN